MNFKQLKTRMFNGYRIINLCKDGQQKSFFVHRLVALTFLGEPSSPDLVVNHKDGNKLNNIPENLEWVTQIENMHHYWTNLATNRLNKKEENRLKKLKLKLKLKEEIEFNSKVICIETKEIFKNQVEAAAKFNVTKMSISKCIKSGGTCHKYHFSKYKDYLKIV